MAHSTLAPLTCISCHVRHRRVDSAALTAWQWGNCTCNSHSDMVHKNSKMIPQIRFPFQRSDPPWRPSRNRSLKCWMWQAALSRISRIRFKDAKYHAHSETAPNLEGTFCAPRQITATASSQLLATKPGKMRHHCWVCQWFYIHRKPKLVERQWLSKWEACRKRCGSCIYQYCLSDYLSVCLTLWPSIRLFIHQSACPPIYLPDCLSDRFSVSLAICHPIWLSIRLVVFPCMWLANLFHWHSLTDCHSAWLPTSPYVSIYLTTCLIVYLSIYLSICLTICRPTCLLVYLTICLSFNLVVYLTIYLSVWIWPDYLSICLMIYLSIWLSVCLCVFCPPDYLICLSDDPSMYLSTCVSISLADFLPLGLPCFTFYLSFFLSMWLSYLSTCPSIWLTDYLPVCLTSDLAMF